MWKFYAVCVHTEEGTRFYTNHGTDMVRTAALPERQFANEDEAKKVVRELVKTKIFKRSELGTVEIFFGYHWCGARKSKGVVHCGAKGVWVSKPAPKDEKVEDLI